MIDTDLEIAQINKLYAIENIVYNDILQRKIREYRTNIRRGKENEEGT